MSPCERKALLTAERLLLAARECVCTAYSVIESDYDVAHPALVTMEASEEVIGEAQAAIEAALRRGTMTEVVPLRPADPGPIPLCDADDDPAPRRYRYLMEDERLQSLIDNSGRWYFEWLADTGRCCRVTDTRAAMDVLASEAMLAGAGS